MKLIDRTGQRFGRLLVVSRAPDRIRGAVRDVMWLCKCDCGAAHTVRGAELQSGGTNSCGCIRREMHLKHGDARQGARSVEWRVWKSMRARCSNPRLKTWADYGGRGITVCERWQDFANFLADMGRRPSPKHTIERTNNDGNYEPGNCCWATRLVQNRNTRRSVVNRIGLDGIERLRALRKAGASYPRLGRTFGVSTAQARRIVLGCR